MDKKIKDSASPLEWKEVTGRKKKADKAERKTHAEGQTNNVQRRREKRIKTRTEAIIIKPAEGKTYAQVLGEIRGNFKPENTNTVVKSIRQTRAGFVLLELDKESKNQKGFTEALKNALGDQGTVFNKVPRTSLEIRDLDSLTTEEEVREALTRDLQELTGELKVSLTKPNTRGQIMAIVDVDEQAAEHLLETAHIKVGWVNCRVKKRTMVTRCYRCLGYGNQARECKGPDRKDQCYKCGNTGHKGATCQSDANCVLCNDLNLETQQRCHIPGSGKCQAFREALGRAREHERR
ncbi:uncharacterized protein LOC117175492 [Belonocnema kinseyi]|uniref:uncharacterized protein LOC117175492 n=1 Tax=Belonocnema kinseyi TaxID=2817044 RepID=UPI00143CE2C4|nr:uncharacterized protein LOC117175492 [Belonocnema kinseyi]